MQYQNNLTPQQVAGAPAYFPMQTTTTGFDFNTIMDMMMPLIFISMIAGMVSGIA